MRHCTVHRYWFRFSYYPLPASVAFIRPLRTSPLLPLFPRRRSPWDPAIAPTLAALHQSREAARCSSLPVDSARVLGPRAERRRQDILAEGDLLYAAQATARSEARASGTRETMCDPAAPLQFRNELLCSDQELRIIQVGDKSRVVRMGGEVGRRGREGWGGQAQQDRMGLLCLTHVGLHSYPDPFRTRAPQTWS